MSSPQFPSPLQSQMQSPDKSYPAQPPPLRPDSIDYDSDARQVVRTLSSNSLSPRPTLERAPIQTITEAELLAGLSAADEKAFPVSPTPPKEPEPASGLFSCCCGGSSSPATSKPAVATKGAQRRPSTSTLGSLSSTAGSQLFSRSAWVTALSKTASFVGFSQLDPPTERELLLPLGPPSLNKEVYLSTPRVIGWGAEGTIRVVKRQRDSQFFVAKVFKSAPNRVHFIRGSFEYTIGHITRGHPNLVSVVDLTRANDLCFTTMEYVPGGNLRMALAKPGYLRSQTLVDGIFVQLCRAILWMHAMGVSHRDIKLENIMWHPRRPLVKLTDFGNCDIFWAAKGFVDDTFESLSTLGSAAFDKASVKQDRHLTDLILRGVGMTGAMSAGQIVTSLGGDLSYLAEKKPNGVAVKGSATPTAAKGKLFTTNDSDTDESDFDDDKADGGSTRSSVDRNDNIPKPYLDDATSPTTYPVDGTDEEKANEGAFKGFLPISPSEFRKPSRYWNPATKTSSPSPPTFAPTDQPTSRQSPIRLSFGVVGTTAYMAPEQFASAGRRPSPEEAVGWYDPREVDVWMIAVAYIYTSTRRIPWGSATESEVAYRRWREGKGNKIIDDWREQRLPAFDSREDQKRYHKQSSSGFQVAASERADLVRRMLECDPGKRPTMEEVVWDPVFVKLSDEFERKAKGLAERGFYVDLNDAPKGGASFSGL